MNRRITALFLASLLWAGALHPRPAMAAVGSARGAVDFAVDDVNAMCDLADGFTAEYLRGKDLTHIMLALKAVRHARVADPRSPRPHISLAKIHEALRQKELAREELEKAAKDDPGNPEVRDLAQRLAPDPAPEADPEEGAPEADIVATGRNDFDRDGSTDEVQVELVKDRSEPGSGDLAGEFRVTVVKDGKTAGTLDLNEAFGEETLHFPREPFAIEFRDYNADGQPDFTLGVPVSSSEKTAGGTAYKLFTVEPGGGIRELPVSERLFLAGEIPSTRLVTPADESAFVIPDPKTGEQLVYGWDIDEAVFKRSLRTPVNDTVPEPRVREPDTAAGADPELDESLRPFLDPESPGHPSQPSPEKQAAELAARGIVLFREKAAEQARAGEMLASTTELSNLIEKMETGETTGKARAEVLEKARDDLENLLGKMEAGEKKEREENLRDSKSDLDALMAAVQRQETPPPPTRPAAPKPQPPAPENGSTSGHSAPGSPAPAGISGPEPPSLVGRWIETRAFSDGDFEFYFSFRENGSFAWLPGDSGEVTGAYSVDAARSQIVLNVLEPEHERGRRAFSYHIGSTGGGKPESLTLRPLEGGREWNLKPDPGAGVGDQPRTGASPPQPTSVTTEEMEWGIDERSNFQRTFSRTIKVAEWVEELVIQVDHGYDDSGDGAVEILFYDPDGKLLLKENHDSRDYLNYHVKTPRPGSYRLVFRDEDTVFEGSNPGNGGSFRIVFKGAK